MSDQPPLVAPELEARMEAMELPESDRNEVGLRLPDDFGPWLREGKWWIYIAGIKGAGYGCEIDEWGHLGTAVKRLDLPRGNWHRAVPASEVERLKAVKLHADTLSEKLKRVGEIVGPMLSGTYAEGFGSEIRLKDAEARELLKLLEGE